MADTKQTEKPKSFQDADEMTRKLLEQTAKADQEDLDNILDQVLEPPKEVPEPVFRELFYPYFTGDRKPTLENNVFAHWAGLVGGHTQPARVINHKGETLFIVPPLIDSSRINPHARDADSFLQIVKTYQEASRVTPVAGEAYLNKALQQKLKDNVNDAPGEYSWLPILQYYKVVSPEIKEVKETKSDVKPGEGDMTGFTFDE